MKMETLKILQQAFYNITLIMAVFMILFLAAALVINTKIENYKHPVTRHYFYKDGKEISMRQCYDGSVACKHGYHLQERRGNEYHYVEDRDLFETMECEVKGINTKDINPAPPMHSIGIIKRIVSGDSVRYYVPNVFK